jgi:ABC-type multidrug transport system ATPase subunit
MEQMIEAQGLTKRFGDVEALAGLDLVADAGQVLAILGPNGAGKTTFIRTIATLSRADEGALRVAGIDVAEHPKQVRRAIGLAGQYAAVEPAMTGRENLRMVARLFGHDRRAAHVAADEVLEQLGLTDAGDRLVRTYSGGMARRLDLGACLVGAPHLLLLDEPTTGLDPRSRNELWSSIEQIAAGGTDVVLTTQYLEEADRLADRIAVLDGGRIAAEGTASELKARIGGEVVELLGPDDEVLAELPTDGTVHGLRAAVDELDRRAVSIVDGARVAIRRPSLDDVFLAITDRRVEPARESDLIGTKG